MKLIVLALACLVSCATAKDIARDGASEATACMKPSVKSLVTELVPMALDVIKNALSPDGKVDAELLKPSVASLRSSATRCAFATAVALLFKPRPNDPNAPQTLGLEVDVESLRAAFEQLRPGLGGGTFATEYGDI